MRTKAFCFEVSVIPLARRHQHRRALQGVEGLGVGAHGSLTSASLSAFRSPCFAHVDIVPMLLFSPAGADWPVAGSELHSHPESFGLKIRILDSRSVQTVSRSLLLLLLASYVELLGSVRSV